MKKTRVVLFIILSIAVVSASWYSPFAGIYREFTGHTVSNQVNLSNTQTTENCPAGFTCYTNPEVNGYPIRAADEEAFCVSKNHLSIDYHSIFECYPSELPQVNNRGPYPQEITTENGEELCEYWRTNLGAGYNAQTQQWELHPCSYENWQWWECYKKVAILKCKNQCNPEWNCSLWSSCTNNQQTRTCTDLNNCEQINPHSTTQSCTPEPAQIPTTEFVCTQDSDCGIGEPSEDYCLDNQVKKNYTYLRCSNPGTPESACITHQNITTIKNCSNFCYLGNCINTTIPRITLQHLYSTMHSSTKFIFNITETQLLTSCALNFSGILIANRESLQKTENIIEVLTDKGNYSVFVCCKDINNLEYKSNTVYFAIIPLNSLPKCILNSDCGQNSRSAKYCFANSVYSDRINPYCNQNTSSCFSETIPELVEICINECKNGECVSEENQIKQNRITSQLNPYQDTTSNNSILKTNSIEKKEKHNNSWLLFAILIIVVLIGIFFLALYLIDNQIKNSIKNLKNQSGNLTNKEKSEEKIIKQPNKNNYFKSQSKTLESGDKSKT